jgi:hypothetical protein
MINKEQLTADAYQLIYKIFLMSDVELFEYLPTLLVDYGYTITKDSKPFGTHSWMYAKGSSPFLMVAHLDIHPAITVPKTIYAFSSVYPVQTTLPVLYGDKGLGADDRAGVVAILLTLKYTNLRPDIFFPLGEEVGLVGTNAFVESIKESKDKYAHLNFMIQFDRMNAKDVVTYSDTNKTLVNLFTLNDMFVYTQGSFSDISSLMPALGISGVNLSCGYYNQHMKDEHLNVDEFVNSVFNTMTILLANDLTIKHIYTPAVYVPINGQRYEQLELEFGPYTGTQPTDTLITKPVKNSIYKTGKDDQEMCDLCCSYADTNDLTKVDDMHAYCKTCFNEPSNDLKRSLIAFCYDCNSFLTELVYSNDSVYSPSKKIEPSTLTPTCPSCGGSTIAFTTNYVQPKSFTIDLGDCFVDPIDL